MQTLSPGYNWKLYISFRFILASELFCLSSKFLIFKINFHILNQKCKFISNFKECGLPFNTSNFYEHNNMPYCEIHYHLKRGSLCSGCQQPINGRCITAMNKKFHPEHFNCSFCLKQLNKGTFKEQNEKPYCQLCFLKLFPWLI